MRNHHPEYLRLAIKEIRDEIKEYKNALNDDKN